MNGKDIVYRTIVIRGQSEGIDKVTADLNKLAGAHQGVTIAAEETSKSTTRLEQSMQRSLLRFDAVARAQNNIERETRLANNAVRQGVIDREQADAHLARVNQHYATATTATKALTQQTGLARHELINLGRQAQDVGVSLASGQSPFMVLVQQGSQIADVFISSGKSIAGFFSQVVGWGTTALDWIKGLLTPLGAIVTAVLAVGTAAIYVASQFLSSSKTIEEALKEQIRLEKEIKALIDARASAESKAEAQLRGQTRFEAMRNLIDLQNKLNKAMEEAAKIAERRATTPTQVAGEMGEAPTAFMARDAPGMKEMTAAFEALKAAQAAGIPGLKQYNEELGKIGETHPELATIIEDMIKLNKEGIETERHALRARAWADALKGVATNAQLAAVGLGSIAQFQINNLLAEQAVAATERMAVATSQILEKYPDITAATAQTLANLTSQMTTQERNNVMVQLEADSRRINATYQEEINKLLREGLILTSAVAEADEKRKNALADAVKSAAELNKITAQTVDYQLSAYEKSQGMQTTARSAADATQDISNNTRETGTYLQNNVNLMTNFAQQSRTAAFWGKSIAQSVDERLSLLPTQFGNEEFVSSWDPLHLANIQKTEETKARLFGGYDMSHEAVMARAKERQEKLAENTAATKENTAATQTMTDVLSPFYSSDPRRTHLGFRAFAGGGIMTAHGELPLKQYQGGGVATSPQVAVYGEGSTPEAYVPVPSGRIPVEIKQPANNNQRPVHVTINVMGNADANTVSALKSTAFQQAQAMRRAMA